MKTNPEDGFYEFLYANETNVLKVPEWAKGVIYYQIFPERFADGSSSNDPSGCQEWGTALTERIIWAAICPEFGKIWNT